MYLLLKMVVFHCYIVTLPECNSFAKQKNGLPKWMDILKTPTKFNWGAVRKKRWDSPRHPWLWNLGENVGVTTFIKKNNQPASVVPRFPGWSFFRQNIREVDEQQIWLFFCFKMFKFGGKVQSFHTRASQEIDIPQAWDHTETKWKWILPETFQLWSI